MSRSGRSAALVVAWSSGFIGAELGARHAAPDTVLVWRCLATAVLLSPWLARRPRRPRRDWLRQAALALLCQCLYLGGVFWAAAAGVPAGTSALVASLQPALVLAVSGRIGLRTVAGLTLGTAGVALTAAGDLRAGVTLAALALPLAAMLSLSAGTLLQQRWAGAIPPMETLAVQSVVTAGFFTVETAVRGHLAPPLTPGFWAAVAWSVASGTASYGLYYLVTNRDGAGRASTLLYLTPATTALWAAPMFGQTVRLTTVAGLLISAAAVALLQGVRGFRRGRIVRWVSRQPA